MLCLACGVTTFAQNNTNSPYSSFGYGELAYPGLAANKAMGGVGYGLRSNTAINTVNPAAYSSVDSMTVMFDFALSGRITQFKEGSTRAGTTNGNLEYIAFQLPLIRNLGMSFGFTPFSVVGYTVTRKSLLTPDISQIETFTGTGGINQLYGGLAYKFLDRFSLGFDVNYAFGYVKQINYLEFEPSVATSSRITKNLQVSDVSLRYGAQAVVWKNNRHSLTLGATYKHKSVLNGTFEVTTENTGTDTQTDPNFKFDLPTIAGGGAFYTYRNRLSAGFDYTREQWADTRFYNVKDSLYNVNRFAAGVSYIPNPTSRNYFNRIKYSLGGNFANSYVVDPANNYALALGFGFPVRSAKSCINTVFEYGRNKVGSSSSLQEQYFKITLSASISEFWFFKRRLE